MWTRAVSHRPEIQLQSSKFKLHKIHELVRNELPGAVRFLLEPSEKFSQSG